MIRRIDGKSGLGTYGNQIFHLMARLLFGVSLGIAFSQGIGRSRFGKETEFLCSVNHLRKMPHIYSLVVCCLQRLGIRLLVFKLDLGILELFWEWWTSSI